MPRFREAVMALRKVASADDIARIDSDHQDYKDSLMKKREYTQNSGSFSVGS